MGRAEAIKSGPAEASV